MRLDRPVRTRFRFGSVIRLNLAAHRKLAGSFFKRHAVTRHWLPSDELRQLVGSRLQVLFHSPPGVLFTFPSRYWSTIGRQGVLSLRGWAPQIHTGFHVPRVTREHHSETGRLSSTGLLPSAAALSKDVRLAAGFVTPWRHHRTALWVPRPPCRNAGGLSRCMGLG